MKNFLLFLFLAVCACGAVFSQESAETVDPVSPVMADEYPKTDKNPVLVFATIFIVVSGILLLRLYTDKMKTDKKENKG
jgi:hypothetical protein